MKFLADAMLGRLARWLRFAGVDCAYERDRQDEAFLRHAADEKRIILTRDKKLAAKASGPAYVVGSDHCRDQLRDIFTSFTLHQGDILTRCGDCNAVLAPISSADAFGRIPLHVSSSCHELKMCPSCSKIYWRGAHVDSIECTLRKILKEM